MGARHAENDFCRANGDRTKEVWQQGNPLWIDRQWLPGGEDHIDSPHGLAGQPIVASLAWIGHPVSPQFVDKVRSTWADISSRSLLAQEGEVGVTRLTAGLVCRYRGNSTTAVKRWFIFNRQKTHSVPQGGDGMNDGRGIWY